MKKTAKKETENKPLEVVADPVMVMVEILVNKTKVRSIICAKGAVLPLPKEQADALVSAELAKIIGI